MKVCISGMLELCTLLTGIVNNHYII